jgi:Ala-tRNA(Pro) deacylase
MAIATTLLNYLGERKIDYDLVEHQHTETAFETAKSAHIPMHQMAKAVVLKDQDGFVVSVLPASHSLEIDWVNDALSRKLSLAEEKEFRQLFKDCDAGAVPALGDAYGVDVIWDNDLKYTADVYIEAGDHEHLIWLDRKNFKKLMTSLPHSIISKDVEVGHWKY